MSKSDELAELRTKLERLERRVERLEDQEDESPTSRGKNGLDHRDRAVLDAIAEQGDPGPRGTVKLYQQKTDVVNERTAKTRAKNLRETDEFETVVRK